jgi:hypothetical protein
LAAFVFPGVDGGQVDPTKRIKIVAKVISHGRCVAFQTAEAAV